MSKLDEAFAGLAAAFAELRSRWYVFGAQAAILHGVARATADIDVTLDPAEHETSVIAATLSAHGFSLRIEDPDFVAHTRVLPVVHVPTGVPVDVVLAGPGIEELFFARVVERTIGTVLVPVASPEDVIVMKILAGRPKDIEDVRGIVSAKPHLDVSSVRETLCLLEAALDQSDLSPLFEQVWSARRGR